MEDEKKQQTSTGLALATAGTRGGASGNYGSLLFSNGCRCSFLLWKIPLGQAKNLAGSIDSPVHQLYFLFYPIFVLTIVGMRIPAFLLV